METLLIVGIAIVGWVGYYLALEKQKKIWRAFAAGLIMYFIGYVIAFIAHA